MPSQLFFQNPEFEFDVRRILGISEGPISVEDIAKITELDAYDYNLADEDLEILELFSNLESLDLVVNKYDLSFLDSLQKLKNLWITVNNYKNVVDFDVFSHLPELETLMVSGGEISSIDFVNLEALQKLPHLTNIRLHEFGSVDLAFLEKMPWVKSFYCGYANEVRNIGNIGGLRNLESLELVSLTMDNLRFLDSLPTTMSLDLCGDEVREGFDLNALKRFAVLSICEMTVNGKPFKAEFVSETQQTKAKEERVGLSNECKKLELIIDNLVSGKETCRIEDTQHTLKDVIDYLRGYLQELRNLDSQITEQGNTPELLKEVHNKYTELWLFQIDYYIDSLPSVIGGLWKYPN